MLRREATHAGSWYTSNKSQLSSELDGWLEEVPSSTKCIGTESSKDNAVQLPVKGARVIIAPHAGYAYSGPAAAWAYSALDLSNAKRIFLLGPSHHHYLSGCALSRCDSYKTPLGDLSLDKEIIEKLQRNGDFEWMSEDVDEAEHSLEMHLPYIYKALQHAQIGPAMPLLVPILVGNTSTKTEHHYGQLFAPYLADTSSVFIVSSDFCHWGYRFRYTYYQPPSGSATHLRSGDKIPASRPLHESIRIIDQESMDAVETGSHEKFWEQLDRTGNTVCGRHPIGVILSATQALREQGTLEADAGKFKFLRYERSEKCQSVRDSSVSYCSAFAVV